MSIFDKFALDDRCDKEIHDVTSWLDEAGVRYTRPGTYHLKIGKVNYYFGRGRIVVDGQRKRHAGCGLSALEALLRQRGYLPSSSATTSIQNGKPAANNVIAFKPRR